MNIRCDHCSNDADTLYTFVYKNARINPKSTGYQKDDITWCADKRVYVCATCDTKFNRYTAAKNMDMVWCARFPRNDSFQHMFKDR